MTILTSVFNNKGGVGKTTLTINLAHALAELGKKVLLVDLDSQCNLSSHCMGIKNLSTTWSFEEVCAEIFCSSRLSADDIKNELKLKNITNNPQSIYLMLKPVQDGCSNIDILPELFQINGNIDLIPGSLLLNDYESTIASRWGSIYNNDPFSIKTAKRIREIIDYYVNKNQYDYVLIDTSPSIGTLNKIAIMDSDAILLPAQPDVYSQFGIRNLGQALNRWTKEFSVIKSLLRDNHKEKFDLPLPVFLGHAFCNIAQESNADNPWKIDNYSYQIAKEFPGIVKRFIDESFLSNNQNFIDAPVGGVSAMYQHKTLSYLSQKYGKALWDIESITPASEQDSIAIVDVLVQENVTEVQDSYHVFAQDFISRATALQESRLDDSNNERSLVM